MTEQGEGVIISDITGKLLLLHGPHGPSFRRAYLSNPFVFNKQKNTY